MRILKTFLLVVLFINIANANTDIKDKNLNNKILLVLFIIAITFVVYSSFN